MRAVDRTAVPVPPSLVDPLGNAADELVEARDYYSKQPAPEKAYSFKAYKCDDVRKALEILFKGKCAYCETPYRAAHPVDVEHYRPKGEVEDDPHHPGYWWLAMRWDNLLPSCIDCNRRRRQSTATPGMTLAEMEAVLHEGRGTSSGKKDAFPTRNGHWVRDEAGDITVEQPLLIDPTRVDPALHISWPIDAQASVAVPVVDATSQPSREGTASIHVYGLNRMGLVQERTQFLLELRIWEATIDKFVNLAAIAPPPLADELIASAKETVTRLLDLAAPERRYSTLAKAFIEHLQKRLAAEIA